MRQHRSLAVGLSAALLWAALAACSSDTGTETGGSASSPPAETETVSPSPETESTAPAQETDGTAEADALALSFTFLDSDGAALADASVQLTIDGEQADYPTDSDGRLTVGGLPRTGTAELVLADSSGAQLGVLELQLSEGSVTDVADSGDGTAVLTVLSGTAETALTVTVGDGGILQCALDLGAEADGAAA